MSKLTRKCPNCGATVPADVKYCRKCHARMDSGRVEVLSKPEKEARPQKRSKDDALRNLPKPVRPAETGGGAPSGQNTQNMERRPVKQPQQSQDGFFDPTQQQEEGKRKKPARPARKVQNSGSDTPRPVSTARGVNGPAEPGRSSDKGLWQIITVLAIIFVIIVVAIILVIRLNRTAPPAAPSDPYENATVITSGTATPEPSSEVTPTPEVLAPPQGLIVADATPVPAPSATPAAVTPVPAPEATAASYSVTPVSDTVYINGNGVNIRSGPGTDHSVIGSESTGKQLQRTGRTSNGWSQVSYNGQTGYVIDSLITNTQPAASNNNTSSNYSVTEASGTVTVAASSGANLRSGPDTSYSIVATVAANTQLTRTGTSGGWTRVSYNGQNVFISTSLLAGSNSGGNTSGGSTSSTGTVKTASGGPVNVRAGAGTGYNVIGSVSSGATVTITGENSGWYQINYNGQTGYVSSQYVVKN